MKNATHQNNPPRRNIFVSILLAMIVLSITLVFTAGAETLIIDAGNYLFNFVIENRIND